MCSKLTVTTAPMCEALRHVDREMCLSACRGCHNYGVRWGCPPHPTDEPAKLSRYKYLTLISLSTQSAAETIRRLIEPTLIDIEAEVKGRAAAFAGECPYCAAECSRRSGLPCRHPEFVRPSLESVGFDVIGLAGSIQHLTFDWNNRRLTLTAALAHDCDTVSTESLIVKRLEPLLVHC
ncbi:MAG: DUF2284 domain-containing protein [Bacteroidales bacterium]|nr:DUF2284 domain-containing protein [Bacteroidales bacterium]